MISEPRYTWRESTDGLRKVLRSYRMLQASSLDDVDSAVTLFDLGQALEDERVLTPRQREAIRLHLLDELSGADAAIAMGLTRQSLYGLLRTGLRRLLGYLQTQKIPSNNQYRPSWSRAEIDALLANPDILASDLAKVLGRSVPAIYQMRAALRKNGLLSTPPKRGRPVARPGRQEREGTRVSVSDAEARTNGAPARVPVGALDR